MPVYDELGMQVITDGEDDVEDRFPRCLGVAMTARCWSRTGRLLRFACNVRSSPIASEAKQSSFYSNPRHKRHRERSDPRHCLQCS